MVPVEHDIATFKELPDTPQTRAPAYRLAFADEDFMRRDDLRGLRLQLELAKPELTLAEAGVASTVIFFGGARIPAPGAPARAKLEVARRSLEANAAYYDMARRLAGLVSKASLRMQERELVIATGGGPGIMEAGNLGAEEVGARSIGLNIVLPNEEAPNPHVSPEYCFNFHYFAIRKMHFLMRAKAAVVFPGGFGTLDELFELLTLIQTQRMARIPVLLVGEAFWRRIMNLEALRDEGTISPEDLELFEYVESAEAAWAVIRDAYDLPDETL
ncbi:MAG: LOG family protein [Pseudomonadota bacterium]